MTQKGRLVIISGPSGSGKSTVLQKLFQNSEIPLMLSVSATTRPPRPGEKEGCDYYFLSDEEFQRRRNAGEFLECKEVFGRGYWYGTLRDPGSMAELEKRLRNRGTESEEAIQRRLNVAAEELALRHHYTHEVINQEIKTTVQHLCQLLTQYHGETIPCSKN